MTTSVALPVVGTGPYTADAKAPPAGAGPHYAVTVASARASARLERSEEAPPEIALPHPPYPPLQGYQTVQVLAVNRRHQKVGFYRGGGSGAYLVILARPFLLQQGRLRFLPTLPGYEITHPMSINDSGEIAGDTLIDSFPPDMNIPGHAVCWYRGIHDLGTGEATGVNNAGDVVGDSGTGPADLSHPAHALLWTHGYRYDLNNCIPSRSGWILTSAPMINSEGQIAGYGLFHGKQCAFLLTPQGEDKP